MQRIKELKEIPLDRLYIDKAQVRTRQIDRNIDSLVQSIAKNGLLEPIVVCEGEDPGTYEIITGQRRFLAHQRLGRASIQAALLQERVDEVQAKVLSLTENLIREEMVLQDKIDVCDFLYKKYGSTKAIAEETGFKEAEVKRYIKYPRLCEPLKELVDNRDISLDAALRAQDAASVTGEVDEDEAVTLAKEMEGMNDPTRRKIIDKRKEDPGSSLEEVIEEAKSGGKITSMILHLGANVHTALQQYARHEGKKQDDAAGSLIEDSLVAKGFLELD